MSQPRPPVVTAWIDHTGDGTLLRDTDKADTELRTMAKAAGFRWSRSVNAWYLPRTWHVDTRRQRVDQLVAAAVAVGRNIPVRESRSRARSAEEVEVERVERAESRAARLTARADRLQAKSDADFATAHNRLNNWPLGQPLVGSPAAKRGQRSFLERERARMDRALDTSHEADRSRQAAASAIAIAARNESPALIARRIDRLEAELRKMNRRIESATTPGTYRDRLVGDANELVEQIAWNQQMLVDAERRAGRLWEAGDFQPGDEALIGNTWYEVKRVNRKTVSVPPRIAMGAERSWTDTVPYTNIKGRRRAGVTELAPPSA